MCNITSTINDTSITNNTSNTSATLSRAIARLFCCSDYIYSLYFLIMCNTVRFAFENNSYNMSIKHPRPALPVLMANRKVEMFPWGRHKAQPGKLPFGFTVRRDVIRAGKWDYWFPKRVLITFDAFMLLDFEQRPKWYENAMKGYLVGLIGKEGNERRVYIVMDGPDIATESFHESMPLTSSLTYRY